MRCATTASLGCALIYVAAEGIPGRLVEGPLAEFAADILRRLSARFDCAGTRPHTHEHRKM